MNAWLARGRAQVRGWGCIFLLCACDGGGDRYVKFDRDADPERKLDAAAGDGGMDAQVRFDAAGATRDAAVLGLDATLNLPDGSLILPDGAILLPDGAVIDVETAIDRYKPELDVSTCSVMEDNTWETAVDLRDEGGYALVPGEIGFGLAYQAIGDQGTCAHNVNVAHIPSTMGFPTPHAVLAECKAITDVTLLAEGDAWRLSWVDNLTNMAELHTVLLDSDQQVAKGEARRTLTDNEFQFEMKPVSERVHGRPLLAWITRSTMSNAYRISAQFLDGGDAKDIVSEAAGHQPQGLALAQAGTENAALAWVGPQQNPGVWLQKLDGNAIKVDGPMRLTDKVAASSSVSIANREDGGGVVYSIVIDGAPQVRFRRLSETGEPVALERSIISPPLRAQGASLFALGGGYAVAYRALPGGSVQEPEIRLSFISKEGNVTRDAGGNLLSFPIAPATIASGRTTISVSVEGQIMVAWVDADPNGDANLLKVARRRLDCQ